MTLFASCACSMCFPQGHLKMFTWSCSSELQGGEHIDICTQRNAAAVEHALDIWYVATFIFIWNTGQGIKMLPVWLPPREDVCYSAHGASTTLWVAKRNPKTKHAERSLTTLVAGWWVRDLFLMLHMCFREPPAPDDSGRSAAICVLRWAASLTFISCCVFGRSLRL